MRRRGSDGELLERLALEIRLNDPRSVSFAGSCIGPRNGQCLVRSQRVDTLHEPALSFFAQPLAPAAQGRA